MSNSNATRRAASFHRIRQAHQTEVAEDYVEMIEDLIAETGSARLVDLAEHMGVSSATAAKIIQRLRREGLVDGQPYRSLLLTTQGHALAAMARRRHRIVMEFLLAIGVTREIAEGDAEGIEHHVSEETLAALAKLTATLRG